MSGEHENAALYHVAIFTAASTLHPPLFFLFGSVKKNDQDDPMGVREFVFTVFFQFGYELYVFLRRARRIQNELVASPPTVACLTSALGPLLVATR
jgi:hypothetical protein